MPSDHQAALLARLGFRDPRRTLRELPDGWSGDARWQPLLEIAGRAADPDTAVRRVASLEADSRAAVLSSPERAAGLVAVFGFGDHLSDILARVPGLAGELLSGYAHRRDDLRERKEAGLVHIAARDLVVPPGRGSFEDTGRALAALLDDCLAGALARVHPPDGCAVMAMGKYGGMELNYSSDIDVLFVYDDGDPDAHERAARELMKVMNGPPVVHRTDADLRPQGRDGPLARSLEAYRAYYRRWAEVWEFQSLIKCRPAAGDVRVGREFLRLVEPFVWPDVLAPDAVEQIRALKARAERATEARERNGRLAGSKGGRSIKLAPGGIRDVEFAVQLLQLVHGRHDARLRVPSTLAALDVLGAEGFVAEADAAELAEAYVFLRHVEHRVQLARGRQTHTLPARASDRELLARSMGYHDTAGSSALERFDADWRQRTGVVRRIHEKLFYRPLLEAFASAPAVGMSLPPDQARELLSALGFDRPARSQDAIVALTSGTSRHAKLMRAILPALLAWLAETPDPDAGLLRLRDLASHLAGRANILAMLRDAPPVAEVVCRALGTGPVLAELLERDPGLIALLDPALPPPSGAALTREARAITARAADASEALRRFKEGVWLRAAVRDLAAGHRPDVFVSVPAELSDLADACVAAALQTARMDVSARTGGPPPGGFSVVAMGRYGGGELSYASDLDVMFVYEHDAACPDGGEARLFHSAVAERLSAILGSVPPIFRVDADLRPEGRNGPLVNSLDGCAQYYARRADTWEFQALTRARHAAGDEAVTARLLDGVASRVYPRELTPAQITEIRRMKARIERERAGDRGDRRFQVKLGTGGLADVEFTVQLLQMRHGHDVPDVRRPNTLLGIESLRAAGLIAAQDADWLRDAYLLLNRVRNHLFLLRGLPTDALPARDEDLERLARSLGYGRLRRSVFLEDYRRVTRRARQVCNRVFFGAENP